MLGEVLGNIYFWSNIWSIPRYKCYKFGVNNYSRELLHEYDKNEFIFQPFQHPNGIFEFDEHTWEEPMLVTHANDLYMSEAFPDYEPNIS